MYRDTTFDVGWQSKVLNASRTTAILYLLKPFTLYTLRLVARTTLASGIPSNLWDVQTLEGGKHDFKILLQS